MDNVKIGIGAIVGSKPDQVIYYEVIINGIKYRQMTSGKRWSRWHKQKPIGYVCGYHEPRGYWRKVTSAKIIASLDKIVAEQSHTINIL